MQLLINGDANARIKYMHACNFNKSENFIKIIMGSSSSGRGGVPPGFRFHPTDEELLHFYLKKKVSFQKFDVEVIREIDLNTIEPWDLFSHKDRKYPTGSRTNRATSAGFSEAPLNRSIATTSFTSCNLQSRSHFTNSDLMIINMNQYNVQQQQQQEVELGSDPNYSLAVPVSATSPLNQYPQIEFPNSISNNKNKQLMMSTSNHYKDHGCENIIHASAAADSIGYQVHCMHPALIERCAQASHQTTAAKKSDYNINLNEWDPLLIATFSSHHHNHNEVSPEGHVFQGTIHPASSGIDQNNQLTPRSEMDFWAYGK